MSEPQQVVYKYEVSVGEETQVPWHPLSRVVHTASVGEGSEYLTFWVAMPTGELPFTRTFYIVGTGHPFPAADIVEGVVIWEVPYHLVWHLIRREPGHTYN